MRWIGEVACWLAAGLAFGAATAIATVERGPLHKDFNILWILFALLLFIAAFVGGALLVFMHK